MRVAVGSVDDFIANLKSDHRPGTVCPVFGCRVYLSILHQPVDSTNKNDATRFQVIVQASAVVGIEDSQYLLDCVEDCGYDRTASGGDFEGSDRAADLKKKLQAYCDGIGCLVLPGAVSE